MRGKRRLKLDRLARTLNYLEHVEIYNLIQRRKRRRHGKRIPLDTLLKEQRIAV